VTAGRSVTWGNFGARLVSNRTGVALTPARSLFSHSAVGVVSFNILIVLYFLISSRHFIPINTA
jgi:hypothetical protein